MSKFIAGTSPVVSYTKIPNCLIRDRRISEGAFRLICWVSSHTPDFEFSFESIKKALGYGREKLRSIIKESEVANYLVRLRIRLENGSFDWQYHIFLDPDDAIAYKNTIGGKPVYGESDSHQGGQTRRVVEPPVAEPVDGSDPPYIKEQCKKNKLKKQEENPPVAPHENANIPVERKGGETHTVVVEVVRHEEEVTVKQSLVVQSPTPTPQEQDVPADENKNHFQALMVKNPKTGESYLPWQGLIYEQGRQRTGNDPAFVDCIAKHISKYSLYKNLSLAELRIEADKYLNDYSRKDGRKSEIDNCWREHCNPSPLSNVTMAQITNHNKREEELEYIRNASKKKFELL